MKLVMLVSRFPYPLEKGDKLRAYYQLKELAKKYEVTLCSLSDSKVKSEWIKEIENFGVKVHVFRLKKPLIYWNTIKQFFTNKPYQTGYFYQHSIQKKINRIISDIQPDHIYCQLIRTTEYVKDIHSIPKTLDYMDALGKGMYRRAEIASGLRKQLFQIEGRRLSEYENRIFDYFNHHSIISEQDQGLINHPDNSRIAVIENGISEKFSTYENKLERKYDLVFTGNMNYPPNVECAEFIVSEILPLLRDKNPNITVLLSGANPHQRVMALESEKGVTVTGWVEDIRTSYAQGKIFLAPLFIGTGLQNKLLEAMAMGLPCITTPLANNALGAPADESVLIAADAHEFAEKIQLLLNDSNQWNLLSTNAKEFVSSRFNWANSVHKLESLMEN